MALTKITGEGIGAITGDVSVDGGTIKLDGNYPTASNNVALGNFALDDGSLSGNANTAIGSSSMTANTSGQKNVGLGESALLSNTTGSFNTALGQASLESNTTASNNTAVGYQAGDALTNGAENVAVGSGALGAEVAGDNTVAIGKDALKVQQTNSNLDMHNVAVGHSSGFSDTTGRFNTFVGSQSGYSNTTAGYNTAVGYTAGYSLTTGVGNTFIGCTNASVGAGYFVTTGSKNTIIGGFHGNQGGLDIRTSSNNIVLSDGDGNPNLLIDNAGRIRHFSTNNTNGSVNLVGEGVASYKAISFTRTTNGSEVGSIVTNVSSTSYNTSSDYRLKENVVDMTGAIDRVKQLSPKRFNFIADADTTVDGFLAHEAQTVIPEAVSGVKDAIDEDGNVDAQGIDQSKIVPLLTGALKEAIAKIEDLEARIETLETQNATQATQITDLINRVTALESA